MTRGGTLNAGAQDLGQAEHGSGKAWPTELPGVLQAGTQWCRWFGLLALAWFWGLEMLLQACPLSVIPRGPPGLCIVVHG